MHTIAMFGPMVATGADLDEITTPPKRVRAILAMLLLDPRRSVPRRRIGDELWGPEPPRSAPRNLRNHLTALRRWPASPGRPPLRLTSQGEMVTLQLPDGVRFDVDEFRAALAAARQARDTDPVEAEHHFGRASAMRRGLPFEDIPCGPVLSASGMLLESLWQTAVEEHAGVLVELSRHEQAREMLQLFVAEQPTRERAWTVLMAACQAMGDTLGALTAYRSAREALVAELGVEPGAELQAAHVAVLSREPVVFTWR